MPSRVPETEIARGAALWLERRGLEVFQEVKVRSARIDLVGRDSDRVVCIEAKTSLNFAVIAQAKAWVADATESWVAVPTHPKFGDFGKILCAELGIGILCVRCMYEADPTVSVLLEARRHNPTLHVWERRLHSEQKTAAPAGTNGGGYVTDWSLFAQRLAAHVEANPGCTLKQAVEACEHHYSTKASAIGSVSQLLNRKRNRPLQLAQVRIEGKGSKALLWPSPEGATF